MSLGNTLRGGDGDDELHGGAGRDHLNGGRDLDVLEGDAGDTLRGGAGDDTYVIQGNLLGQGPLDTIIENSGGGTDTVESNVSFPLPDNVENLPLVGTQNLNGTGNDLANVLTGNAGDNTLSGLGGSDTLLG